MEFQFGDFVGTPAMFVQAVSTQEPFSGKESLRCTMVENVLIWGVSAVFLIADESKSQPFSMKNSTDDKTFLQ